MYDVLVCCVAAFALYFNTLTADFAYDDSRAIIKNQDLRPDTPLTQLLKDDFWGTPIHHSGSHKSYRPLCVLSFRLNYAVGELDPFGYHLTNVILHVIATGLFVTMARRFLRGAPSVYFAGLLFSSHPIHTEAVAGVVGRADVGACIFTLLSFMCYVQSCDCYVTDAAVQTTSRHGNVRTNDPELRRTFGRRRIAFLVLSGIMTFCATFTKEQGIMVIAINAAYKIFVIHRMRIRDLPKIFYKVEFCHIRNSLLLMVTLGGALLSIRFYATGLQPPIFAPADNPASVSTSFLTRTLTFLYLPAYNAWMLICPKLLSFDWSMESIPLIQTLTDLRNLWSLSFYSILVMLGLTCFKELDLIYEFNSESSGRLKNTPFRTDTTGCASYKYEQSIPSTCNGFSQKSNVKESRTLRNGHAKKSATSKRENNNSYLRNNGCDITRKRNLQHCSSSPERNGRRRYSRSNSNSSTESIGFPDDDITERSRLLNVIIVATSFLIFPFIPATNALAYVGFVIAERILYIPSIGFCLLLAEGASQIWQRSSDWGRKLLVALVIVQLCLFSVKTVFRNEEWQSEESLYRAGIKVNPPKALGNLANIYKTAGRTKEAEDAYRMALTYRRNMADVHYNLGVLLQEVGRFEEAIECYQLAIKCRPRMSMAHLNLGIALTTVGRNAEAEAVYRQAATLDDAGLKDPRGQMHGIISSLFNLGRLLQEANRHEDALIVLQDALRRKPEYYAPQSLYNMLGETEYKLGNLIEAERWFKESLRSKGDHVPAHLTYANLLGKTNRAAEAETLLERAVILEPENSNVFRHYGQFWHDQGDYKKASEFYHSALMLQPNDFEITFNLANSLRQGKDNEEAEVYYREAVNLKPDVANGHVNLGAMLHLNGKLEEAEESYLKALSLKPEDPTSLQNLKKLRNLMAKKSQSKQQELT